MEEIVLKKSSKAKVSFTLNSAVMDEFREVCGRSYYTYTQVLERFMIDFNKRNRNERGEDINIIPQNFKSIKIDTKGDANVDIIVE